MTNLAVSGAVFLHRPARFSTQGLQYLIIVAMLGELVVAIQAQASKDLGSNSTPTPLSPLIVLPFLPCG